RRLRLAQAAPVGRDRRQRHGHAGRGHRPARELVLGDDAQDGQCKVFYGEQRMTMQEALRSATWNAAYAAFQEQDKGSLEIGKLADIAVLDRDPFAVPAHDIRDIRALKTFVGGREVYCRH
ncbi:MAG: amidohydrolase family protein, partial [Nitrospiraceae bacterium]|nr:amidohydrolase family protein [Nitrospiraceae bacterium]